MKATLVREIPHAEVSLIRGGGGDFIVIADGQEIWNKRAMNNAFPEETDIVTALQGRAH